ncbi:conserved hypothetical protein [Talaromyces stipitatus ATCC 10500]|uniref:BZIP domain-containing protein n=1 Tax=Talaromyces stipitatus (strain ATCC 10500 / CBS 375.48 / QM 6759 / NRRL 1006) TaxID=441959 RepID=B8MNB9_TALSN|nr:uncharacterized protein TSTA_102380 [Talaromyces stipitatus ATCC 10500]EED14008.1 conserved hypothetical protein [Talaromyces stipitatus ATCC 10500]
MASMYDENISRRWTAENNIWPEPCVLFSELQDPQSPHSNTSTNNCTDPAYDTTKQYPGAHDSDSHTVDRQNSATASKEESPLSSPDSNYDQDTSTPKSRKNAQRRKEQNRLAQRAFRERKENYIQSLLHQIDEMNQQHMRLIESYQAAKNNALCLQIQVEELQRRLEAWNNTKLLVLKVGATNNTQVALCSMPASDVVQETNLKSGSNSSSLVLL